MNLSSKVKKEAKHALSDYWAKAVAILLLLLAIMMFFTIMNSVLDMAAGVGGYLDIYRTADNFLDDFPNISIISLVITGLLSLGMVVIMIPLCLGVKRWYYLLSDGYSDDLLSIFNFFASAKLLWRSVSLAVLLGICKLAWTVLLLAPAGGCAWGAWYFTKHADTEYAALYATLLIMLGIVLALVGLVMLAVQLNRYFLAEYYMVSQKDISAYKTISLSCKSTKGMRIRILAFKLSFVGWFALSIFVMPVLYVQPYYEMSSVLYARYLIETAERNEKNKAKAQAEAEKQKAAEKAAETGKNRDSEGRIVSDNSSGTGFVMFDAPKKSEEK
ncbi:MAG: DUF975 family protein [Oscillospiraceae bacterium]|nr:DUF975 family protein [Oscillospiraceae bacterium]